jgi:hypothetical protein
VPALPLGIKRNIIVAASRAHIANIQAGFRGLGRMERLSSANKDAVHEFLCQHINALV